MPNAQKRGYRDISDRRRQTSCCGYAATGQRYSAVHPTVTPPQRADWPRRYRRSAPADARSEKSWNASSSSSGASNLNLCESLARLKTARACLKLAPAAPCVEIGAEIATCVLPDREQQQIYCRNPDRGSRYLLEPVGSARGTGHRSIRCRHIWRMHRGLTQG